MEIAFRYDSGDSGSAGDSDSPPIPFCVYLFKPFVFIWSSEDGVNSSLAQRSNVLAVKSKMLRSEVVLLG
jgi:hypothetical protein